MGFLCCEKKNSVGKAFDAKCHRQLKNMKKNRKALCTKMKKLRWQNWFSDKNGDFFKTILQKKINFFFEKTFGGQCRSEREYMKKQNDKIALKHVFLFFKNRERVTQANCKLSGKLLMAFCVKMIKLRWKNVFFWGYFGEVFRAKISILGNSYLQRAVSCDLTKKLQ